MRLGVTGPYPGTEGTFREDGICAPMVARWPGRLEADAVSGTPVLHADLYRTLAAMTPAVIGGRRRRRARPARAAR